MWSFLIQFTPGKFTRKCCRRVMLQWRWGSLLDWKHCWIMNLQELIQLMILHAKVVEKATLEWEPTKMYLSIYIYVVFYKHQCNGCLTCHGAVCAWERERVACQRRRLGFGAEMVLGKWIGNVKLVHCGIYIYIYWRNMYSVLIFTLPSDGSTVVLCSHHLWPKKTRKKDRANTE